MSFGKTLSRGQTKRVIKKALAFATVPETEVRVRAGVHGNTRFANNGITTTGDVERISVSVTASADGRSATASGTQIDDASLKALVAEAESLVRLSPVDPEHMPPLGPSEYPKVDAHDDATANIDAVARATTVEKVCQVAGDRSLVASGFLSHANLAVAVGNSAGLLAFQSRTELGLSTTFRTKDGTGSGYKAFESHRAADLDPEAIARAAADKAEMSVNPKAASPGRHTVVLEAQAVADLLGFLAYAWSQREADEGRSYFSKPDGSTKVSERLFDPRITLYSDPGHVDYPASAFDDEGAPLAQEVWVEGGVVKKLTCGRYWAQKTGQDHVPRPSSLHMLGEGKSLADLVAAAGTGYYVTRFHYNRMLERRSILVTGLTRDGTFAIDNGKIDGAVNNFRYNDSPLTLLSKVRAMGTPERVATQGGMVMVVPPLVVDGFQFASVSEAV